MFTWSNKDIQNLLNEYVDKYNRKDFIETDPISIPHRFVKSQDIEIMAFWTCILSWGNRKSIIQSGRKLCELMDQQPHQFIMEHREMDRRRFEHFVHRTFQYTDSLYFMDFLQFWYGQNDSLESAFLVQFPEKGGRYLEKALMHFKLNFFNRPIVSNRTKKHISDPSTGSRCKRLLMFLRWMVRKDDRGVDFGLWRQIQPSMLHLPLDLHVERTARALRLLTRKNLDWKAVCELTDRCAEMDPSDPCKYDFALFGLSLEKKLEGIR
ncbi:MAG: TIGR02757 family protein [Saprospiraceae bacterium]|nr:TIGR02757 family protein [Saprospiraceae bacterium]